VIQSYKTAKDHIVNIGSGLHGIDHSNYIDEVVKTHYRNYYLLDPVLGQRPNVKPWYMNEDEDDNDVDETKKESRIIMKKSQMRHVMEINLLTLTEK
jgi:hypothetical protein